MSTYIQVPVFAGQGTSFPDCQQSCRMALACAKEPAGAVLLTACSEAFLAELASLDKDALQYANIDASSFDRPQSLLGVPDGQALSNPIMSGTRLVLQQTLAYLSSRANLTASPAPSTLEVGNGAVIGFSSGVLSATVVATSSSTLEYINNAVAAFRVAFWIGFHTNSARRHALESAGLSKDDARPWALVFVGWSKEDALTRIAEYNAQKPHASHLHVTAVIDASSVTVSGRCDVLAAFAEQAPSAVAVHKTSMDALYHTSALIDIKTSVLADIARRGIRFPDFADLNAPLACTATGKRLTADSFRGTKLVHSVVDMVLTQPVSWDKVVQALVDDMQGARLRLINVGPGAGLTRRMARRLPRGSFDVVDITVVEDVPYSSALTQEPVAIVGMAVNMPGAPDVGRLWEVLEQGINTVSEIPEHRFKVSDYKEASTNRTTRHMKAHTGNFIDDPDGFDAPFFKISPREARSMDPQARVLLHTAYEALEDAGYVPDAAPSFAPETFGCYIGAATSDYVQNLRKDIDVYYGTGTLRAFLSGRISYAFKWGGPSVVLDTACSSSMVSIYQACRALTNRDCNAALAGGVNVITSPDMFLGLDRGHFLSPTGQCKAFDASADGYSRSEGCGLFVLKRLSDALAENDHILGVIRGVEVNQSGLAQSITHPHAPTQTKLFRQLLERSGVDASRVSVVEAHGTGTQAGDPAELESIRSVLCVGRPAENPLHVTSVKANIGHLESASGAAGLAKLLLMLKHDAIPRLISLRNLNPRIKDLESDHTIIDREQVSWRSTYGGESRMALLNNFGAAGSNGALLLEEHRARPVHASHAASTFVFGISAKSPDTLLRLRNAYIEWLQRSEQQDTPLVDIAYTATARRIMYDCRIAVTASSKDELIEKLSASKSVASKGARGKVAFVFSGQGSQYRGMGSVLYRTSSLFRETVDECHSFLVESGLPGVLQVLCPESVPEELPREFEFEANQSAIFVLEYALARMWMSWGVQPDVVVGHSLGEYAAHVIAGVLSPKDALMLVASRARLMVTRCDTDSTSMLAVNLGHADVDNILASSPSFVDISLACYNSPVDSVVSGPLDALKAFKAHIVEKVNVKTTLLSVPFGYHSRAMGPILSELATVGQRVTFHPPNIAIVSNVLGKVVMPGTQGIFASDYYAHHCSEPVMFEQGITSLCHSTSFDGVSAWIEIGPHSATLPMLKAHPLVRDAAIFVPSLRKKHDAWSTLSSALAQFYLMPSTIRWREVFAHTDARCTHLPTYPWSKTKFWVAFEEQGPATNAPPQRLNPTHKDLASGFTLLHRWVQSFSSNKESTAVFETPISYLARAITGHSVGGAPLCPASVYHELALAGIEAASERLGLSSESSTITLRNIEYIKPLVYNAGIQRTICSSITLLPDGLGLWRASSRLGDGPEDNHSTGMYKLQPSAKLITKLARAAPLVLRQIAVVLAASDAEFFSARTVYEIIFPRVVDYGQEYRTIDSLRLSADGMEGYAVAQLPSDYERGEFVVHPVFMDTLLHVAGFAANLRGDRDDAFICHKVEKVIALPKLVNPDARYGVYFRNAWLPEERTVLAESYAVELDGQRRIVAHIKGMHFRRVLLAGLKRNLAMGAGTAGRQALVETERAAAVLRVPMPPPYTLDVNATVKRVVAEACGMKDINPFVGLESYGVDSLMSIEVAQNLRAAFPEAALETGVITTCSTTAQIVEHINLRLSSCSSTSVQPSADEEARRDPGQAGASSLDVKGILASALGVSASEIKNTMSLDALGMDSLSTIEVLAAFKKALAIPLPDTLLESAKTVKDVHDAVAQANADAYKVHQLTLSPPNTPPAHDVLEPVRIAPAARLRLTRSLRLDEVPVPLQAGPGTALFLVHDGSGLVSYLKRLAPLGRALWGFNSPYFLDGHAWDSLEAMASEYADRVLKVTGDSESVILGGWSYGGIVAFEAARQLRAQGTPVLGVLLIDSPPPRAHAPLSDALIAAVADAAGRSPTSDLARLVTRQFTLNSRLLGAYGAKALEGPFEGRVVMLRSSEGLQLLDENIHIPTWLSDRREPDIVVKGWEDLIERKIKVLDIPGNHFEVFAEQNIDYVSKAIVEAARYIDERQ